jgi:hypothetical protein
MGFWELGVASGKADGMQFKVHAAEMAKARGCMQGFTIALRLGRVPQPEQDIQLCKSFRPSQKWSPNNRPSNLSSDPDFATLESDAFAKAYTHGLRLGIGEIQTADGRVVKNIDELVKANWESGCIEALLRWTPTPGRPTYAS